MFNISFWLSFMQARKENGDTGYIPETYVQIQREHQPVTSTNSQTSDYSASGFSEVPSFTSSVSLSDSEVQAAMAGGAIESGKSVGKLHADRQTDKQTNVVGGFSLHVPSDSKVKADDMSC